MHAELLIADRNKDLLLLDVDVVPVVVHKGGAHSVHPDFLLVLPLHDGGLALCIFVMDQEMRCFFELGDVAGEHGFPTG